MEWGYADGGSGALLGSRRACVHGVPVCAMCMLLLLVFRRGLCALRLVVVVVGLHASPDRWLRAKEE